MSNDYQPIDCGFYDQLELACMRGNNMRFKLTSGEYLTACAINLSIEDKQEWLEVQEEGKASRQRIRLDNIASIADIN